MAGQQVPVAVEGGQDFLEVGRIEVERQPCPPHAGERLVGVPVVEQGAPPGVAVDAGADRVQDTEIRRQPGFQGCVGEQPRGEAVQRGDRRVIELPERPGAAGAALRGLAGLGAGGLERLADTCAQLGCGVLGESDRGETADRFQVAAGDHGHDPVDQLLGLAAARAGIDEQVRVVRGHDTVACRLVQQPGGHPLLPAGSARPAYRLTRVSLRICAHSSSRALLQTRSNGHQEQLSNDR